MLKTKLSDEKNAIFNHSYSHNPLCYNSIADKEHGTDGSKKSKGNLHTLVFMNSTQGGGGSFNQNRRPPTKGAEEGKAHWSHKALAKHSCKRNTLVAPPPCRRDPVAFEHPTYGAPLPNYPPSISYVDVITTRPQGPVLPARRRVPDR